jgi:multidrug efflux pump subunit AcrA (membrane-fusion protein)
MQEHIQKCSKEFWHACSRLKQAATFRRTLLSVVPLLSIAAISGTAVAADITVPTIVRVLDQADVPAKDKGVLTDISVRAGDRVSEGQILAQLDDKEQVLALSHAELQLKIASRDAENALPVQSAEAQEREARKTLDRAELAQTVAERQAKDDVAVRLAVKTRDASQADLDRATRSRKNFASSVSLAELERLQLLVDRNVLEIEKSEVEREIAGIKAEMEQARVSEQEQIVERLRLTTEQARRDQQTAATTMQIQEQAVALAQLKLENRRVRSPLAGVVVEVHRHNGEWVEAGMPVLRVVRLDRLKAETFIDAAVADESLRGASATIQFQHHGKTVSLPGEVTFVSPEVDTVNRQVLVSVEIDNSKLVLKPGMKASLSISVTSRPVAAQSR